jgi:hypothetical protein
MIVSPWTSAEHEASGGIVGLHDSPTGIGLSAKGLCLAAAGGAPRRERPAAGQTIRRQHKENNEGCGPMAALAAEDAVE